MSFLPSRKNSSSIGCLFYAGYKPQKMLLGESSVNRYCPVRQCGEQFLLILLMFFVSLYIYKQISIITLLKWTGAAMHVF